MTHALEEIWVSGMGSLRDVTLRPGRLTVLVGPNGSGKSNLLRVLKMVPLMRTGSLQRFVGEAGGAAALLHYGPKRTAAIEVALLFSQEGHRNRYYARLGFAAGNQVLFLDEQVGHQHPDAVGMLHRSLGAGHWESKLRDAVASDETAKAVNYFVSQLTFYHFHDTSMTSALRTGARRSDDRYLRSDGSNLPAYLARLASSEDEGERKAFKRISRLVRRIAPAIKELDPVVLENGSDGVRLDWLDDQDERFGVAQLSDGTLRALALITALSAPASHMPGFISIDEPELGLHPAAIQLIVDLARSAARHTQILFATQSTAFLDHFEPGEVVVAERQDGATVLTRPDEAMLEEWLTDYSLSEVFDKGVIGGRP